MASVSNVGCSLGDTLSSLKKQCLHIFYISSQFVIMPSKYLSIKIIKKYSKKIPCSIGFFKVSTPLLAYASSPTKVSF